MRSKPVSELLYTEQHILRSEFQYTPRAEGQTRHAAVTQTNQTPHANTCLSLTDSPAWDASRFDFPSFLHQTNLWERERICLPPIECAACWVEPAVSLRRQQRQHNDLIVKVNGREEGKKKLLRLRMKSMPTARGGERLRRRREKADRNFCHLEHCFFNSFSNDKASTQNLLEGLIF